MRPDLDVAVCVEVVLLEFIGLVHLNELHAGSDACKVSALIDVGKCVVMVGNARGVGKRTRCVAELHLGKFLCGLQDEVLMTEGIGEDDVAALIDEVGSGIVAFARFGDARLHDEVNALRVAGSFDRIDEVLVVRRVAVVQGDEADLQRAVVFLAGSKQASARDRHGRGKTQSQKFLHIFSPLH